MGKEFVFWKRRRTDNMVYKKFIDESGRKWGPIHSITVAYPERTKPYSVSLAEKAKVAIKLTVYLQSNQGAGSWWDGSVVNRCLPLFQRAG